MSAYSVPGNRLLAEQRSAMTIADRPPHAEPVLDREYWIRNSVGFRVDTGSRRVGFVEATMSDPGNPDGVILSVRTGLLGRRLVTAHSDDVAVIAPRAGRIWLTGSCVEKG